MRWYHWAAISAVGAALFMACSGGADPVEDDGEDFNGPGGGAKPDITALCEEQCIPTYPAGETDYRATRSCLLCDVCYNICDFEGVNLAFCPDALEAPQSCSGLHQSCDECVNGACALDVNANPATGLCAGQYATCQNNTDCVGLTNCVSSCVANTPAPMQ